MTTATKQVQQLQSIPLVSIVESSTNPRKHFDPKAMEGYLIDSIIAEFESLLLDAHLEKDNVVKHTSL